MKVDYTGMVEDLKGDLKKAIEENKRSEEQANKKSELKNCPFCDGEAYLETIPNLASNEYVVCCNNKECLGFYIGYGDIGLYGTKEGAIKAWNTRKPVEEAQKRLEEVKVPIFDDYIEEYEDMVYLEDAIEIIKEELM